MGKNSTIEPSNNWYVQSWRGEKGPFTIWLLHILAQLILLPVYLLLLFIPNEAIRDFLGFWFLAIPLLVWTVVSFWRGGVHNTLFYGERTFSFICAAITGALLVVAVFFSILELLKMV